MPSDTKTGGESAPLPHKVKVKACLDLFDTDWASYKKEIQLEGKKNKEKVTAFRTTGDEFEMPIETAEDKEVFAGAVRTHEIGPPDEKPTGAVLAMWKKFGFYAPAKQDEAFA